MKHLALLVLFAHKGQRCGAVSVGDVVVDAVLFHLRECVVYWYSIQ